MINFSQFITESSRVQWIPHPELKSDKDGKVDTTNIPRDLKTGSEKPQPEGHKPCKTCEGTGKVNRFTGKIGQDKETGIVHVQRVQQTCTNCGGGGHIGSKSSQPSDQDLDPRYPYRGD